MTADTIIIGAGPAGLSAAYELTRSQIPVSVLEMSDMVGGIARTETYKGYAFDIGGHRFFTKSKPIEDLWRNLLGRELIEVDRKSRIYYKGRYINYPLSVSDIVSKLGVLESFRILASFMRRALDGNGTDANFEEWVVARFGKRLFQTFFKEYTEKVWGIPCRSIEAEWAEQRIKGLSFLSALSNAVFGGRKTRSLIRTFLYPRLGPGMMWQRLQERIELQKGELHFGHKVSRILHDGQGNVLSIECETPMGNHSFDADWFVSSMALTSLVACLDPLPPQNVLQAANSLKYRAFLLVVLILDGKDFFPDQWLYIHDPSVKVGRVQNYANWSPDMVPDAATSSLGVEFFCDEGDAFWNKDDKSLIQQALDEVNRIGLINHKSTLDAKVIRVPRAYPVYALDYRRNLSVIQEYLQRFTNLLVAGRNGTFRYNNMDHSMLSGLNAARAILGKTAIPMAGLDSSYLESGYVNPVQHAGTDD